MRRVLAISVHPDDETLGCGGTMLKHRANGDRLSWLIATRAHEPRWSADAIERKALEVQQVSEAYGMERCIVMGFPTARLDNVPQADLISRIGEALCEVRPEVIYLVHEGDVHSDHRAVFAATMSTLKPFSMASSGLRRILCYETLSSTEGAPPSPHRAFVPNVFNDITPFIDRKVEIMGLYQTEAQADPLPRGPSAIKALARHRGATVGVEYAEAFMLIRELDQ